MDCSEPISMYGTGALIPPHRRWSRLLEWSRLKPRELMHLDQILPGFCQTSQMSIFLPKMYFELCILMYHAMLNSDNHTISSEELVCCDPSCISKISSFDDRYLEDSAKKVS